MLHPTPPHNFLLALSVQLFLVTLSCSPFQPSKAFKRPMVIKLLIYFYPEIFSYERFDESWEREFLTANLKIVLEVRCCWAGSWCAYLFGLFPFKYHKRDKKKLVFNLLYKIANHGISWDSQLFDNSFFNSIT